MTQSEIRAVFARAYNGAKNVMTPKVLGFYKRGDLLVELSTGSGIAGTPMYGVTVITVKGEKMHNLSCAFPSKAQAMRYIQSL